MSGVDPATIEKTDSQGVLGVVERFAEQIERAWTLGVEARGLPDGMGVDSIVVLGMGGSGVSGDFAATVLEPRLALPFRTIKSYGPLPEWIGRNTLVFAVSYSGNTEETLAALEEAHDRGSRVVAISSGGELAAKAEQYGIAHVAVPSGQQPRASLGYLAMPILGVLLQMGLAKHLQDDVTESIEVLTDLAKSCDRAVDAPANPARDLASRIAGRIAIVYGGYGLGATAAQRFKCDLNEYGKVPAFWNYLPELNHNEIVGWTSVSAGDPADLVLVLLRDDDEHERIALRFEVTRSLIEKSFVEVVEVPSVGRSPMARLLSLIYVTQLASIYVALDRGVDPGPVEVIESLKAELARR